MLPRQHRLQRNKDFDLVFKKGRTFHSELLLLKLRRNNLEINRFGFIIGKKISKKSTVRNEIKRRLSEIIRKKIANIKPGFDVVIRAGAEIIDKNYKEIEKEIEGLFRKAKLIQ